VFNVPDLVHCSQKKRKKLVTVVNNFPLIQQYTVVIVADNRQHKYCAKINFWQ
jgi:hypothetical protein